MELYHIKEIDYYFKISKDSEISYNGHILLDRDEMVCYHVNQCMNNISFNVSFVRNVEKKQNTIKGYPNSILLIERQSKESIIRVLKTQESFKDLYIRVVFWNPCSENELLFDKKIKNTRKAFLNNYLKDYASDIIEKIMYNRLIKENDNAMKERIQKLDQNIDDFLFIWVNDFSCVPFIRNYIKNDEMLNRHVFFTGNMYHLMYSDYTINSYKWYNIKTNLDPLSFSGDFKGIKNLIYNENIIVRNTSYINGKFLNFLNNIKVKYYE